jgi:hypothetical protein
MLRLSAFVGLLLVAGAITVLSSAGGGEAVASPQSGEAEYTTVAHVPIRICCKRGRHDWWATPRACVRAGGYRVAGWHCRHDALDYRVCCKRGLRDWWTTARQCRRAGGYQVAGRWCRID